MTQPPVRFENYPPDDSATPDGSASGGDPVIRPYVPDQLPPDPASSGSGRRTVIGLLVGVPLAAIILSAVAARANQDNGPYGSGDFPSAEATEADPGDPDYPDDPDDPASYDVEFSVGAYTATAPDGWSVNDDGSGTVEVTKGVNRLTAISIETGTSTLAVDEIAHLAKRTYVGFSGKIGDPVDRSSADLQHATMDGSGTFNGKGARLMVELWIDDEGSGLLVTRVLTAKVASTIAIEAQEMLDELSGDF